jgi:hypothetical protein
MARARRHWGFCPAVIRLIPPQLDAYQRIRIGVPQPHRLAHDRRQNLQFRNGRKIRTIG